LKKVKIDILDTGYNDIRNLINEYDLPWEIQGNRKKDSDLDSRNYGFFSVQQNEQYTCWHRNGNIASIGKTCNVYANIFTVLTYNMLCGRRSNI